MWRGEEDGEGPGPEKRMERQSGFRSTALLNGLSNEKPGGGCVLGGLTERMKRGEQWLNSATLPAALFDDLSV